MKHIIILVSLVVISINATAQGVTGKWVTVDDQTGIDKSVVQIFEKDGKLYGKVVGIIDKSKGENPLCTQCPGDLKDKPILGMMVVRGLSKTKDGWASKNAFLEPESGWIVDGKLWLEGNVLKVRADVGIFHRTQTWKRLR